MVGGEETASTQQVMSWQFTPGEQLDYQEGAEVRILNDVLSPEILSVARQEAENLYKHGDHFRTNRGWGDRLLHNSTPVLITTVYNQSINSEIQRVTRALDLTVAESVYQIWTPGSYIPWHNDGYNNGALTVYLSDHDKDDGGYFMYDDGKGIKAVKPKVNRAVMVKGGIYHCVSTVNQGSRLRTTIQVWCK
jgi:Rps23 Pro-64 3,4-dihydroxylase Tpa1-like proline 4-hydroxylase